MVDPEAEDIQEQQQTGSLNFYQGGAGGGDNGLELLEENDQDMLLNDGADDDLLMDQDVEDDMAAFINQPKQQPPQ